MLALLAVVSVFSTGCWTVAYNRDTGVSMRLAASPTPSPPPSVVIRAFVKAELQAFDHSSYVVGTSIISTWKELQEYVTSASRSRSSCGHWAFPRLRISRMTTATFK
jgi:hypothetical protein